MTLIRAEIEGETITAAQLAEWETRRLAKASRLLGIDITGTDLAAQRLKFADAKLDLGPEQIRQRLASRLRVSDVVTRATAGISRGARTVSICDLFVTGGDATQFVEWFSDSDRPDFERSMLAANPDHFLITATPDGQLEVIETTGGSPLPSRFLIDEKDVSTLRTALDPSYTANVSGVAHTSGGKAIGGVRHQFRNTADGFHAHLLVEFPKAMAAHMINAHRWHLAVEFTNWITFAFTSVPQT